MISIKRIENSLFRSNSYVLFHKEFPICWLIDCGDVSLLVDWIKMSGKTLKGILLTHIHIDHIYGLNDLIGIYPSCKVYTSAFGKEGLYSDKLNFSRYHGNPFIYQFNNVELLKNGDWIELFPKKSLLVLETPGHDPSCLSYKIGSVLFTGDSYIPGLKVVTSFPKSNKEQALMSVEKILKNGRNCRIYPGHAR